MITTILEQVAALPPNLRFAFDRIFYVDLATGQTVPPASMEPWIKRQFGSIDDVRTQTIVKITNRLTLESAIFNPLRARRPTEAAGDDAALEDRIARELAEQDIFHAPLADTTGDVFGRIRGEFCVSASNVAKYEGWHGLVIFDEPHPLRFGLAQIQDYLDVALRWIAAAHAHDPEAIYPIITWNCLPKSGATLMHGHMQVALARGMHYARIESWRRAAEVYDAPGRPNYYDDLFAIHETLGLALPNDDNLRIFVHLTPLRNREIVVLAPPAPLPSSTTMTGHRPLAAAIYAALRRLIDDQGVRAFNMAIALPPLGPTRADWRAAPIIARIADRGDPLTTRSDWGAMELFAAGCVVADPFEVARLLRTEAR